MYHNEIIFHTNHVKEKKNLIISRVGKDIEKWKPLFTVGEGINWFNIFEKPLEN